MEKKSESWCTWLVSGIKSLICPRKKVYREGEKKSYLGTFPKVPFQSIANFLNMKETMTASFANKKLHANTEIRRTEFKNLSDCALLVLAWEKEIMSLKFLLDYDYVLDYKTGEKFDVSNYDIRRRTLRDFAEQFIRPKDINQYNNLMQEFDTHFQDGDNYVYEEAFDKRVDFIERLIVAGSKQEIREFIRERVQECVGNEYVHEIKWNYKKQIKNYQTIMTNKSKKSYKPIYNHLKNNPNPEKPERKNYIKAYEELKKEEGGCSIF